MTRYEAKEEELNSSSAKVKKEKEWDWLTPRALPDRRIQNVGMCGAY
jgi:hypothetical protein